jgi:four helix bundle protein
MQPYSDFVFPHERLDAFHAAIALAEQTQRLAQRIPRGYRHLADQLQRAGSAPALLISEGANRRGTGEKRQRFGEAAGETGEAVAIAQVAERLQLVPSAEVQELRLVAARLTAMLSRLVQRFT